MVKNFKWDVWDYDDYGEAYIIAKDECPEKDDVTEYIANADQLPSTYKRKMVIKEGWCKWQVRTDWSNGDGTPLGGYVVQKQPPSKKKKGWFPVWIVRRDFFDEM